MDGFINVTAFTILAALWLAFAVAFDRPTSWRSSGRSRGLLVAPLLGPMMRGRERKHLAAITERLEGGAQTNGGGQQ